MGEPELMWPFRKPISDAFSAHIESSQLRHRFANVDMVRVVDADYAIADKKWYTVNVAQAYEKATAKHGLYGWRTYHDCDDKALIWKVVANGLFAKDKAARRMAQAPACGICFFKPRASLGGRHAINWALVDNDGEERLIFIEPQTQLVRHMSMGERKSIYFVYA